jgi:hypothetical protein
MYVIFVKLWARCARVVAERMAYSDAKQFCGSQTFGYQGLKIAAQLMDLRSAAYTQYLKGIRNGSFIANV